MRLWVVSDLHAEFTKTPWRPASAPAHDVLVAAGDIAGSPARAVEYLRGLTDKPIILVVGNHEFYGNRWRKTIQLARDAAASVSNVHFLENDELTIGGVRFLGCTLWTDFAVNDNPGLDARTVRQQMTDFQKIRVEGIGRLSPAQWLQRHHGSVTWLKSALSVPHDGPTVVVTHHAPHRDSIHPRFQGDPFTAGFVSHLPELVAHARLWVHGHTHAHFDYVAKGCRIVCNPLGYPGEETDFKETLVVEL